MDGRVMFMSIRYLEAGTSKVGKSSSRLSLGASTIPAQLSDAQGHAHV